MSANTPRPEAVTDVREMRRILTDMRYSGRSPFTKGRDISTAASLVHYIMSAGQHQGWSGEDVMTALAYHALLQLDEAQGRILEQVRLNLGPFVIQKSESGITATGSAGSSGEAGA